MGELLRGIGVSPGIAVGPVYRLGVAAPLPTAVPVTDLRAEDARAVRALQAVATDLARRAAASADPTAAAVLRAQVLMVRDPVLRDAVTAAVQQGRDAPHAITAAFGEHRAAFEAAGGQLAERVADLDDLRDRAVAACLERTMPGIPTPGHPFVLIGRDLAPADTALLDPRRVRALVTALGGPTSHTAILARALGLPAVVSCAAALDLPDGAVVTVDGTAGTVAVGAEPTVTGRLAAGSPGRESAPLAARALGRRAGTAGPGRTADGHPIAVLANIGSARDLSGADVDGVGLFRTELLFLDRAQLPGLAEQAAAYAEVFTALRGKPVVVRTLDAGGDKPLPFLSPAGEPNPALGVRGVRIARRRPDLLDSQLAAIAHAARTTGADVRVMAPMVATVAEAAGFAARCRAAGLPAVGVMVEIPAAALRAAALLEVVDFLSVGTNDLSQYTFAADRACGELADLLDPWQPALLSLIAGCAAAGRTAGKPVGVCGEAAADPGLAVVLAGLGVSSLSMSAPAVAAVRDALAAHTLETCRRVAMAAVAAADAPAARRAAEAARLG